MPALSQTLKIIVSIADCLYLVRNSEYCLFKNYSTALIVGKLCTRQIPWGKKVTLYALDDETVRGLERDYWYRNEFI